MTYTEGEAFDIVLQTLPMLEDCNWDFPLDVNGPVDILHVPGDMILPYLEDLENAGFNIELSANDLPEQLLYIFNFSNGAAVVSADRRIGEIVFAVLEDVNLSIESFDHEIATGQSNTNSESSTITLPTEHPIPMLSEIMYIAASSFNYNLYQQYPIDDWQDSLSAKLSSNVPLINQHWPFNDSCPAVNDQRALAGCGPIAMFATIIYRNYPRTVYGFSFDRSFWMSNWWEDISILQEHRYEAANIVYALGVHASSHYNVRFDSHGQGHTSTNKDSLVYVMNELGYAMSRCSYDGITIRNMLMNDKPVILSGDRIDQNNISHGHFYIVSEILVKNKHFTCIECNDTTTNSLCYMYCNLLQYHPTINSEQNNKNGWFYFPLQSNASNANPAYEIAQYYLNIELYKY